MAPRQDRDGVAAAPVALPHRLGPRPTLEDVARAAGVSRGTVSRVINGGRSVRPAVMATVNEAITRLGYSVNQAARNLARGRTGSVAFVISERQEHLFEDPNFGLFVRVFSRELRQCGIHLLVTAAQDHGEESYLGDYLSAGHVDGALLALPRDGEPLLGHLLDRRLPLVVLGRPLDARDTARASWVAIDDEYGAFLAASHLASHHHGPIATITGPLDTSSGRDRLAGFHRAVGARFCDDLVAIGDWSSASGEAGAEELLAREPKLAGLFVASDLMALGALRVLRRHGRRVPEDVGVAGFDNSASAVSADPPLTTVSNPIEATALEAIAILSRLMEGCDTPQHVVLDTELIVRASV